jgi:hypothetical protein
VGKIMGIMGAPRDELCSKKHLTKGLQRFQSEILQIKRAKDIQEARTASFFLQMKP